jgi:two-component system, LytTR family, sensor kinase
MKKIINHILFWGSYIAVAEINYWFFHRKINVLDSILVSFISISTFYVSVWGLFRMRFRGITGVVYSILVFLLCLMWFYSTVYIYRFILAPKFSLPQIISKDLQKLFLEGVSWFVQYYFYAIGYFFLVKSARKEQELRIVSLEKQRIEIEKAGLQQKQLQTEAAFLRSQINPHFLQNTLNFLYGKTRKHASELSEGVLLLSEIMHYSLEATKNTEDVTTLKDEVRHLQNLINLQQLRFSNQLYIELATTGNWEQVKLPPLTLITLAENAFKYGEMHDAKTPVTICLHVTEQEQQLHYKVTNKKKTGPVEVSYGIGHENIRNRLSMRYQNRFELQTKDEDDIYTVNLTINLTP